MRALTQVNGAQVFNGCTGSMVSLKQLATAIGEALGQPITTVHAEARTGDIRHSLGDPVAALKALGFTARTTLPEGLGRLLRNA